MKSYNIRHSLEYNKNLCEFLPGGTHYNFYHTEKEQPIHYVKAEGSRLWDMDGNEYLDLYGKSGALILGHNHPKYNESIIKMLSSATAVDLGRMEYETCEILCDAIPSAEKVRFCLSGTEAIQNALRLARGYTGKQKFIRFIGHYHGNADNIMGGDVRLGDDSVPYENYAGTNSTKGRMEQILEQQSYLLSWNNSTLLEDTLRNFSDQIAAVIMEPFSVNGGGIMPHAGYMERVRAMCDKYHVLLIYDEVITGFRVDYGGAQKLLSIKPDISVFGKCISGGSLPVSVITASKEIMRLYEEKEVVHGGTFNGYSLGLAAVKITLEILNNANNQSYETMKEKAEELHRIFLEEAQNQEYPLTIQGHATCSSFHCAEAHIKTANEIDKNLYIKNKVLKSQLQSYGILTALLSRMYVNIALSDSDIVFFRDRVGYALADAKLILKRMKLMKN